MYFTLFFQHFRTRVNSSSSQKTAGSHVPLRRNLSGPVTAKDPVKGSKALASLVLCTQKKIFFCLGGAGFL